MVRAQRRDDAKAQGAGQGTVAVAHQFRNLVGLLQNAARVGNDGLADRRQGNEPRGPLDQWNT